MSLNMLNAVDSLSNNVVPETNNLEISGVEQLDGGGLKSMINSVDFISDLMSSVVKATGGSNISNIQNPRSLIKLEKNLHKFDIDSQIFSKVVGEGAKIINELTKIQ